MPHVSKIIGSVTASVFLQQVIFRWMNKGRRPFYKFNKPCKHVLYKPFDSWVEELGMGETEFETSRDIVATRVKRLSEVKELLTSNEVKHCIIYITVNNVTTYYVNSAACNKLLQDASSLRNSEIEARLAFENSPMSKPDIQNVETRQSWTKDNTKDNNSSSTQEFLEEKTEEVPKVIQTKIKYETVTPKPKNPNEKNGITMPLDFGKNLSIIDDAQELGYDRQDVEDELKKYTYYYTAGKGRGLKIVDWTYKFLYIWLTNNYQKGFLKRNGKKYQSSASDERVDRIKELTNPDFFSEFRGQA